MTATRTLKTWTVTCRTGENTWTICRNIEAANHLEAIYIAEQWTGGRWTWVE